MRPFRVKSTCGLRWNIANRTCASTWRASTLRVDQSSEARGCAHERSLSSDTGRLGYRRPVVRLQRMGRSGVEVLVNLLPNPGTRAAAARDQVYAARRPLLRNAPHLVKSLPTTIPIMSVFSGLMNGVANFLGASTRPAWRGAVPVKLGLSIYDWVTSWRRKLPRPVGPFPPRRASRARRCRRWRCPS